MTAGAPCIRLSRGVASLALRNLNVPYDVFRFLNDSWLRVENFATLHNFQVLARRDIVRQQVVQFLHVQFEIVHAYGESCTLLNLDIDILKQVPDDARNNSVVTLNIAVDPIAGHEVIDD